MSAHKENRQAGRVSCRPPDGSVLICPRG